VNHPGITVNGDWEAKRLIHFENGMYAFDKTQCPSELQAEFMARASIEGNVNIIPDRSYCGYHYLLGARYCDFVMQKEGAEYSMPVDLWLDKKASFENLPKIKSVKENTQKKKSRHSKKKQYHYIIELLDGTSWKTEPSSKRQAWVLDWKEGSEVIKLGNNERFCLINKTKVEQKEYSTIGDTDHLVVSRI
jgi:hypothetical protein